MRSSTILILLVVFCYLLNACLFNPVIIGEYKPSGFQNHHTYNIIHLDADSTGYYTWWTDIQMTNEGVWTISNDTLFFTDQSWLHPKNKTFVIQRNKLIAENGTVFKKMNYFQRKTVYRGR